MANKPFLLRFNDALKLCLKSSTMGEKLYKNFLQPIWRAYRVPHDRRLMQKHGYEILQRAHCIFRKYQIPYYCDAGTLLGFIRDGGFIKGDDDFDFSVMPDYGALSKALKVFLSEKYRFVHAFEFQGRLLEFTIMDPMVNLPIDVFQSEYCDDSHTTLLVRYLRWFKNHGYKSYRDNTALEFRFVAPTGIKEMVIHNVVVDVPLNAEAVLDDEYGSWRTPDSSFKSDMIPHVESPHFAHLVTESEAVSLF